MEEEGKKDPRRKEKERMIRKGSGIFKKEGENIGGEEEGLWRGEVFRGSIIKASWTRVLFGD